MTWGGIRLPDSMIPQAAELPGSRQHGLDTNSQHTAPCTTLLGVWLHQPARLSFLDPGQAAGTYLGFGLLAGCEPAGTNDGNSGDVPPSQLPSHHLKRSRCLGCLASAVKSEKRGAGGGRYPIGLGANGGAHTHVWRVMLG